MGRVVVITGAASGLGLSLTQRFLDAGDRVYGLTKTKKNWDQAKKQLAGEKNFFLYQADVCSEVKVKRVISRISREAGPLDILIHSAGYAHSLTRVEKESLGEFQKNISNNLTSTFLLCKHALPLFKKQKKGWIVNISSMAGKRAVPLLSAYSASKFGVVALTQSIAKENPDSGFKCITVCPGGMNTKMREKLFGKEDASHQQSPDFVADKILEILEGKIPIQSGDDVVIRHHQVTVNPLPAA